MIRKNQILCKLCSKIFFKSNKVKDVNNREYEICPYCGSKWISYLTFPN